MHYGAYAFAKNRSRPTIIKLKNTGGPIGQRNGFSATDLKQLNTLYDCKSKFFILFGMIICGVLRTMKYLKRVHKLLERIQRYKDQRRLVNGKMNHEKHDSD